MQTKTLSYPEHLHLGCGDNYLKDAHNVDVVPDVGPDEVVDLDDTPWPWPDNTFLHISAEHVFEHLEDVEDALRESARILKPGGRLSITLPIGINSIADPDHKHLWTWQTPEFYCGKRHWDVDVGLSVVDKSVSMHSLYDDNPSRLFHQAKWRLRKLYTGPGEWCFNQQAMSGEFQVVFQA